jgi:hypothetical protein
MGFVHICKARPALDFMDEGCFRRRSFSDLWFDRYLLVLPSETLVPRGTLPEGLFVAGLLIFFGAMAAVGAPLCNGCITGILLGMYR